MLNEDKFPPHLPESLCSGRDIWVGSLNPHNPQVEVTSGPDIAALRKAHEIGEFVTLHLASRVADMDDEDPSDDKGHVRVEIEKMYENRKRGTVCFLASGDLPFVGESSIWVYEYDGQGKAGADLLVAD